MTEHKHRLRGQRRPRQVLLERTDEARCRARQEILPRHHRLDFQVDADGQWRHLLGAPILGGKPVAGIFNTDSPEFEGVPDGWMSYLAVDDVDARTAKAIKAGANLMRPIFDVPNVGRIAILSEPGGAGIGWMTPVA